MTCNPRPKQIAIVLAAAASCCGLHGPALAQVASDSSSATTALDEIIVTAQKRSERLQDVPMTITSTTGAQLEASGISDTRNLSQVVPGLTFAVQGAYAEPAIRGISTTTSGPGQDNPVATYLDGVYQPSQEGNIFDLPDVARTEVLKGPQGTLFGRNVVGGAISVYTLDPSFTPGGTVSVSDGVYSGGSSNPANEVSTKFFVTGPLIQGLLAGSLAAYYVHSQGYLVNDVSGGSYGQRDDAYVHGKLLATPWDGAKIVLGLTYRNSFNDAANAGVDLYGVTASAAVMPNGVAYYPGTIVATQPWHVSNDFAPKLETHQFSANLRGDFDLDWGKLTSITGYTYVNPIGAVDVDASVVTPANAPTCFAYFSCQSVSLTNPDRSESQEFDFASPDIGIFSFVSGLYAYHDSAFETVNANDAYLLHSQVVTSAYAAFGEATAHVTEQLAAVAGVRYSWEHKVLYGAYAFDVPLPEANEGTWHSWTPRFSLMYRLTDSINTYATYSQGFKSGVLDATSFSTPALQPEKLDAYEVGIKLATTSAALNVSAFYYDYKDIQVKVFASGESTLLQNAAAAKIYGLDADGTLQINDQLQIRGGASYVPHADYTDYPGAIGFVPPLTQFGLQQVNLNASGDRMIRTPKLTANLAATYTTDFTIGRLALTGNLYHSSSYSWEITNRVNTDEYSVLNARLSFTPRDSIWTVSLFGNNLANKAYVDGALPSGSSNLVFYAPPREAGVSVDAKF